MSPAKLGTDSQALLQVVYEEWLRADGRWPTFGVVDKRLDQRGVDAVEAAKPLVPRFLRRNGASEEPQPGEVWEISVPGLALLQNPPPVLDEFLKSVKLLTSYEQHHAPSAGEPYAVLTSQDLAEHLRIDGSLIRPPEMAARQARLVGPLLQSEPLGLGFTMDSEGSWTASVSLPRHIRRFRGLSDLDDYLTRSDELRPRSLRVGRPPDVVTTRRFGAERRALVIFASHQSSHKALVAEVAFSLRPYGVELFVAHDSIEADTEWHERILKVLQEADAGVAFLHEEFRASDWCAQEVGWLLGRGVPVISLKFDLPPYGPLGRRQAIPARSLDATGIADEIIDALARRDGFDSRMVDSLIYALGQTDEADQAVRIWQRLGKVDGLGPEACLLLVELAEANPILRTASADPASEGPPISQRVADHLERQPNATLLGSRISALRALH